MALMLWGRARAANVQKVTWCLSEIGLEYRHQEFGVEATAPVDQAYLAAKNKDIVPVLDDDGFVLWEGNAIARYLAARYGKPPFWPQDARARGEAGRWMDYQLSTVRGHIHPLMRETNDAERTAFHARKLAEAMQVLERALESHAYLVGDDFTVGDIPLGIVCYRWRLLDILQPELPHLDDWLARLQRRSAFRTNICPPQETTTALRPHGS